jgi:hypothetical protein
MSGRRGFGRGRGGARQGIGGPPLVNAPSADIQFHILAEHHVLL